MFHTLIRAKVNADLRVVSAHLWKKRKVMEMRERKPTLFPPHPNPTNPFEICADGIKT